MSTKGFATGSPTLKNVTKSSKPKHDVSHKPVPRVEKSSQRSINESAKSGKIDERPRNSSKSSSSLPSLTLVHPISSLEPQSTNFQGSQDTHLSWISDFNFKKLFPSQKRATLSQTFHWGAASITVGLSAFLLPSIDPSFDPSLSYGILLSARALFLIFIFNYFYVHRYRKANRCHVKGFRLVISRGLFKRYTASVPLQMGVQVYIRQNFKDFLFRLYRVQIIAPLSPDDKVTELSGFSYDTAQNLFYWISQECDRQVFVSPDADKLI